MMTARGFLVAAAVGIGMAMSGFEPVEAQIDDGDECIDCSSCALSTGALGHRTFAGDDESIYYPGDEDTPGGIHQTCFTKHCGDDDAHGPADCDLVGGELALLKSTLEAVTRAAANGDVAEARRLTELPWLSDRVQYIAEREAVQAFGCNDVLIAHIPVGAGLDPRKIVLLDY